MFRYYYKVIRKFADLGVTRKDLIAHLLFSATLRTFSYFLIPFMAAQIVDNVTIGNYKAATMFTLAFLGSALFYLLCHHYNYWAYYKNARYIHKVLQDKILEKVVSLDDDFTDNISQATIINTAFDDVKVNQDIPDCVFDFLTNIVGIGVAIIILICVDLKIGLFALGASITSILLFTYHMKKRDYYDKQQRDRQDHISDLYSQIVDGHKEVHTFNMHEDLRQYLEKDKNLWRIAHRKKRFHQDLADAGTPIILGLGRIVIYLVTAQQILAGNYGVAMLVLVMGYYEDIQSRYETAVGMIYYLSRCSVSIDRVHKLLNYENKHEFKFGKNNTDDIHGKVEFKNVSFKYNNHPLMTNVSFTIHPNSLTAVVGKSGSGKSTIFRLLLRLYKPQRGKIYIDEEDIQTYTKKVYATNVSIVTQKPFIFEMTIRENLNLVDADVEHQIAACKTAGIHDEIMKLEKGYDTKLVGDAGNLSTGQKQQLALARTLLSKSEILLFDEVTSSLDADTSKKIMKILKELKKDHTIIVITHKPELMRKVDDILVIDHGKLVARGSHKELMEKSEHYKTLQK